MFALDARQVAKHEGLTTDYESPALTAELQARVDYTVKHSTPQRTDPESIRGCSNR